MNYLKRLVDYNVPVRLRKPRVTERVHAPMPRTEGANRGDYMDPSYHHGKQCLMCCRKLTVLSRTHKSMSRRCDECINLYNRWYYLKDETSKDLLEVCAKEGIEGAIKYVNSMSADRKIENCLGEEVFSDNGEIGQPDRVGSLCTVCVRRMRTLADTSRSGAKCRTCQASSEFLRRLKLPVKMWKEWVVEHGLDWANEYVALLRREKQLRRKHGVLWSPGHRRWLTDVTPPERVS